MIRCVDFVWRTRAGLAIVGKHRVRSLRALCESATIFPQILFSGRTQQHSQTHTIERPTRGLDHVHLDEARKSEALLAAAEQLANLGNCVRRCQRQDGVVGAALSHARTQSAQDSGDKRTLAADRLSRGPRESSRRFQQSHCRGETHRRLAGLRSKRVDVGATRVQRHWGAVITV
jgi:hypothetical protein